MLLAGDIGGTKTVLALYAENAAKDSLTPIEEATFPSKDYESLEDVVNAFLNGRSQKPLVASFGVAGPVLGKEAKVTNLPWHINIDVIQQKTGIPQAHLLNDLESIATAIPHLSGSDLAVINEGQRNPTGAIAVVAPGTGLGEGFLIWDGHKYIACPSEGGHAAFAPTSALQRELLAYLEHRFTHVSFERVCSGSGIPNLYQFLKETDRYEEPTWLHDQLESAADPTPVIMIAAINKQADICVATLDLFLDILGSECSNMAVKVLSTGGLYLGGGIPPRIVPQLQNGRFMANLTDKGRFSKMMQDMPVNVILNAKAGLLGAAYYGLDAIQ